MPALCVKLQRCEQMKLYFLQHVRFAQQPQCCSFHTEFLVELIDATLTLQLKTRRATTQCIHLIIVVCSIA